MPQVTTKTISIQKWEYLKQRDRILSALEAERGVDNWEGYADCFEEEEEEAVDSIDHGSDLRDRASEILLRLKENYGW